MKLGFSGTRFGMTPLQSVKVRELLEFIIDSLGSFPGRERVEIHHGDCVGADEQIHHMAKQFGCRVVIHPPVKNEHRAYCEGDEMRLPYPHLTRNANIVHETEMMLTAPPTDEEQFRGGTWSTTRLARDHKKLWRVVLPSGVIING